MQSTTYVPEEKEYLANCMKYKFHLKGVFAIPEISQLFWHGICSALEYGQEIARILISSGFIWSLGHVSNAATISPGVLAILSAGAGNIWLIVAPSLIMQMDVDRIINVGWSAKGLKIGWQK